MEVKYKIYNPSGNITALVIGDKYTFEERKAINDIIMKNEPEVEQVGFLSKEKRKLTMAGGEFCGNATRCAALYYLKRENNIKLEISEQKINAGIEEVNSVWCEIPIKNYKASKLKENVYKVELKGITILVVNKIKQNENLKEKARELMIKYNIDDDAVGVMFTDKKENYIKIFPVVWVKKIDTLFLEHSCGSGTIAVTMVETLKRQKNSRYMVLQPSGEFLETLITIENNTITKAILKGNIKTDNKIRKIIIKE